MRYAYGITAALLAGGAVATMTSQLPVGAQVAQNASGAVNAAMTPRPGAPVSFADLVSKLQPAVVNISTTQKVEVNTGGFNPFAGSPFEDMFPGIAPNNNAPNGNPVTREATSLGSGFIISADGYIVTNNHVISGGAEGARNNVTISSITVTLPDRKEYVAKVIGRDPVSDLALLKIEAKNLPFVQFGDSTRTRVGDWVVAIGNPYGLGGTVTAGIVSALHRNTGQGGAYDRYIQTDASINQGNSGGPMFDLNGNVIGINTLIFSPTGGNVGIGFAIPAEQAKPVIDQLMGAGKVRRGYLGVGIQPMTEDIAQSLGLPKNQGEIVQQVVPGQAAAKAGIQQGDVILTVNGRTVTPDETLSFIVANLPVGTKVPIELLRGGERKAVTAIVGERPSEDKLAANFEGDGNDDGTATAPSTAAGPKALQASTGLSLQLMTPQIAQQLRVPATTKGLVIAAVDPNSDAAAQGLQRGDIILSINQRPVASADAAWAVVDAARKANRPSVLLLLQRGPSQPRYIGIKLTAK
ncbi:Do family serine endopeptidase [Aquisediminimonas sediminicola]|uniref:Do family serine endopeptidase n=1 Tax=Alteraquisediminimonas sediminicola TaxID=2676787 RepID=UPI001C8F1548